MTELIMLQPIEIERNELGYHLDEVREGRYLRVVHRPCEGSNTCVFLVHGGGGRAGQFKHLIKGLESRVNVVAFDFLGHGDSPKPNQPDLYTANEHLEDLSLIFDKYKCDQNMLVGHCYGAIHVLRLIKLLYEKGRIGEVTKVALISLGDKSPAGDAPAVFSYMPPGVLEVLRPLARSSSNAAVFTPATDPALVAFENSISDGNRMYMMKVLLQDCSNQALWDSWLSGTAQILITRNIPRVMLGGDGDGVFSVETMSAVKKVLEIPDDYFHVIKDAGHLSMLEKPEQVLEIIEKLTFSE